MIKYGLLIAGTLGPVLVSLWLGVAAGFYATVAITAAYICSNLLRHTIPRPSIFAALIAVSVIIQTFTGLVNAIVGINDPRQAALYSLLGALQVLGLCSGAIEARHAKVIRGFTFNLCAIGLVEFAQALTRILVVGLWTRSSAGFTFLFPAITGYISGRKFSVARYGSAVLLILAYSALISLSGLRSVLFLGIVLLGLSILTVGTGDISGPKRFLLYVLAALALLAVANKLSEVAAVDRAVEIVITRFHQTLLADKLQFDPEGGRLEESVAALKDFSSNLSVIDVAVGRGYGFVFADTSKDFEQSAHIHITPVAYMLRGGIIGLATYGTIILYSLYLLILALRRPPIRVVLISTGIWGLSSLFAGMIAGPAFWFALGYCIETLRIRAATPSGHT